MSENILKEVEEIKKLDILQSNVEIYAKSYKTGPFMTISCC